MTPDDPAAAVDAPNEPEFAESAATDPGGTGTPVSEPAVAESANAEPATPAVAAPEAQISSPVAPEASSPDLRSEMLARFEHWLDQMLAGEPLPRGVPEHLLAEAAAALTGGQAPAPEADLYTLFSSLTALTGEIRLQGRAFKQLTDLLAPLAETPAALAELRQAVELENPARDDIPSDQVCDVMIDLYDRLQRGLRTCDDGIAALTAVKKRGWFARLFAGRDSTVTAKASVQAIRDAAALTVARLQAALQQWGVQRIGQAGEPFDPDRMTAVEVRPADGVRPGIVLVVQRSGYAVHGVPRAAAQVTVSKASV